MQKGDKVWFRGRYSDQFSLRGEIEVIDSSERRENPDAPCPRYGVRLENGNFHWAAGDQLMPFDESSYWEPK